MADKPVIGFIGLGPMGHGMAANLLKAGHVLHVKGNRNRAPVDDLVGQGATEVADPRTMAGVCDIVHLCLSNSAQVEQVIRGADGILASGKSGLVVIDTTTADPVSTAALAAEMAAAGMVLIDAPLGRTPKEAEAGQLDCMVGASAADFARIKPVLDVWAGNIVHVGPTGAGHKMKLIMNYISLGYAHVFAEALTVAVKSGLTPQSVHEVIGSSRMANGFYDTFMACAVGRNREAHKFSIANAAKDSRYAASMAMAAGVANPVGAATRNAFAQMETAAGGDLYVPMLADHIAALNGVDLEQAVKRGADDAE